MKPDSAPRKPLGMMLLMGITAVLITISGIVFKQDVWRILPLYVSLVISLLQSRVNRFAPLIGSCNALVYGAVYLSYDLYASALYAVLVSSPLQFITFLRWQKNAYEKTTYFQRLTGKKRALIAGGFVGCWVVLYLILSALGSGYLLLDNTITLLGILNTVLMMLAYIEYTVLMIVSTTCSLILYIVMIPENPEQVTYLVYTLYALVCNIVAVFHARKNYLAQQNLKNT